MYEHPMYSALSMLVHGKALYKNIIIIIIIIISNRGMRDCFRQTSTDVEAAVAQHRGLLCDKRPRHHPDVDGGPRFAFCF